MKLRSKTCRRRFRTSNRRKRKVRAQQTLSITLRNQLAASSSHPSSLYFLLLLSSSSALSPRMIRLDPLNTISQRFSVPIARRGIPVVQSIDPILLRTPRREDFEVSEMGPLVDVPWTGSCTDRQYFIQTDCRRHGGTWSSVQYRHYKQTRCNAVQALSTSPYYGDDRFYRCISYCAADPSCLTATLSPYPPAMCFLYKANRFSEKDLAKFNCGIEDGWESGEIMGRGPTPPPY